LRTVPARAVTVPVDRGTPAGLVVDPTRCAGGGGGRDRGVVGRLGVPAVAAAALLDLLEQPRRGLADSDRVGVVDRQGVQLAEDCQSGAQAFRVDTRSRLRRYVGYPCVHVLDEGLLPPVSLRVAALSENSDPVHLLVALRCSSSGTFRPALVRVALL